MLPAVPQAVNELVQNADGSPSVYPYPPNIAGKIPPDTRKKIFQWVLSNYIWPQIMERRPFEDQWDKLQKMARALWEYDKTNIDLGTRISREQQARVLDSSTNNRETDPGNYIKVADTVIFDAVDRLTNLNHFISWKNEMPVQYRLPSDTIHPYENDVYAPTSDFVKSANGWLKFNAQSNDVYRKSRLAANHHYTYGVSFVMSEMQYEVGPVQRRQPNGQIAPTTELIEVGVSFEPMSIRKLWLNWRIPIYNMEYQPCPFYFEFMPRFAIIANQYSPVNPFGYENLDTIQAAQYLFAAQETSSMQAGFKTAYPKANCDLGQLLAPEYNVELKWKFFPVMPFDPETGEFEKRQDGTPVPLQRFIMETFGNNLTVGFQEIISLRQYFYPRKGFPLYGSAHMPTLDDGVYSPAIGSILENHYVQLCKALLQVIENKDWINDPPTEFMSSCPSLNKDINAKGAKLVVNTPHDIKRREPFDATQTSPAFIQQIKESIQTSSKSTDAILGKAMGSRTSATEATNAFQTSMSGITTDVNLFSLDIHGGYANRVWIYTGLFIDPQVVKVITGSYGFAITGEHLAIRLGLKWDTGSTFIESITRQQNIQWILSQSNQDPSINRAALWKELLTEWRFNRIDEIVNDQGFEDQVELATDQACKTYIGAFVMIDPNQNHQIALKVKTSFLADRESVWNTTPQFVVNVQKLVQQIQIHQEFIQLQQMQQLMQQRAAQGLDANGQDPAVLQRLQNDIQKQQDAAAHQRVADQNQAARQSANPPSPQINGGDVTQQKG